MQEQEGDGDCFIDDVGDEYGVFQTAFFEGFRAQKNTDADGYKHDRCPCSDVLARAVSSNRQLRRRPSEK